jgi:biotin transporter BioY
VARLWRPIVLSAALLMHLGITVSMGLGAFSAAMLTGCLAFVPPWVLRAVIAAAGADARSFRALGDRARREA